MLGTISWEETSVDARNMLKVLHIHCLIEMPLDPLRRAGARGGKHLGIFTEHATAAT